MTLQPGLPEKKNICAKLISTSPLNSSSYNVLGYGQNVNKFCTRMQREWSLVQFLMDSSCPYKTTYASTACCLPAGIWLSELLQNHPYSGYNVFLLCSFKFFKFPNKLPWYQFPELVYHHWVRDVYGEWLCAYTYVFIYIWCAHIHIYEHTELGGWGRLWGSIKRPQGRGTKELQDICNIKAEWGCLCVEGQGHQQGRKGEKNKG